MPQVDADRNLHFGLLAVQMGFITRDELVAAMNARASDEPKTLGQSLVDRGVLNQQALSRLEVIVRTHLEQHGDDLTRSLAALGTPDSVAEGLRTIGDPDLNATRLPPASEDAYLTRPIAPEDPYLTRPMASEDPYLTRAASSGASGPVPGGSAGPPPSSGGTTRFTIIRPHAKGGLGQVSVARDEEIKREVALKEIQDRYADDPGSRSRFLLEAEITGALEHPGIVPVYGLGHYDDGRPYYAMRFIRGNSLHDEIKQFHQPERFRHRPGDRVLELRKLLGRFLDVCNAMEYAHSRGVLHRDLKPGNVMVGKYGETLVVDWGLAKTRDPSDPAAMADEATLMPASASGTSETLPGAAVGTPQYMSPEQAAGRLDAMGPPSDVYSLGATLYELLTGRPPFKDAVGVGEVLRRVELGEFPPPRRVDPSVPPALEAICLKAMALRPEDRYGSPRALADDVEHWLADEPVSAHREGWSQRVARWARRHRAWVQAGAAALLIVALVALVASVSIDRARRRELAQRIRADQQRRIADQQRALADELRVRAQRVSADVLRRQGESLCDQGDVARGLHWMARSLDFVPPEDTHLQQTLRANLAGWARRVFPLKSVLPYPSNAIAFHPDGRSVAVGGKDSTRTWAIASGQPTGPVFAHPGQVRAVAFRPDGRALLTGGDDATARLWDAETGRALADPLRLGGPVVSVAFRPDGGAAVVVNATAKEGVHEVRLWDAIGGRPLGPAMAHHAAAETLAIRPDRRAALVVDADRAVAVRDLLTGERIGEPLPHPDKLQIAAFRPDGLAVLLGGDSGSTSETRLWEVATGRALGPARTHPTRVFRVTFRPDGKAYATRGPESSAILCDAIDGKPLGPPLAHQSLVMDAQFSPDGRRVLTGSLDRTARLWDAETCQPIAPPWPQRNMVISVAFSPDGATALVAGSPSIMLWSTSPVGPGDVSLAYPNPRIGVSSFAFRPDGRVLLTGSWDGTARLWDASALRPSGPPAAQKDLIMAIAIARDGKTFLTGGYAPKSGQGSVQLWDAAGGKPLGPARPYPGLIWGVAISPDGRTLAAAGNANTALLWDAGGRTDPRMTLAHESSVNALAFSPDGKRIATGSNPSARLWDAATGRPLGIVLSTPGAVNAVAFRPDGRVILTGGSDNHARSWDAATGRPIGRPLEHADRVNSVAFSPDGRSILTGSRDRTARLWDAATSRAIGPPLPHKNEVRSVAFHPDGRSFLTDDSGIVRVWQVPAPPSGPSERIRLWVRCLTGLDLDESGDFTPLDVPAWERDHRRLETLGGTPR